MQQEWQSLKLGSIAGQFHSALEYLLDSDAHRDCATLPSTLHLLIIILV